MAGADGQRCLGEALDGPRAARPEDLPSVVRLCDAVFRRADAGTSMGEDFPLLFDPANAPRLRVIARGGRVIAHAGFRRVEALLEGAAIPVGLVGAVATDPAWRGRGLATALLADLWEAMRRDGVAIASISGWRGLYARCGAVRGGRCRRFRVSREAARRLARPGISLREALPADVPRLVDLHGAEAVRLRRTEGEFARLLAAAAAAHSERAQQAALLLEAAGAAAYLVLAVRERRAGASLSRSAHVVESGGDRGVLAGSLDAVLDRIGTPRLLLPVLEGDGGWEAALARGGLAAPVEPFPDTALAVVDPSSLAAAAAPYWGRVTGGRPGDWRLAADGGTWRLEGPGLRLDGSGAASLNSAVLAAPAGSGPPALPVPWPRGLDFT